MTTTTHPSPPSLDIESYFIERLTFRAFAQHDTDRETSGGLNVDFDVERRAPDALDFRIAMYIQTTAEEYVPAENPSYALALTIVGYFTFSEAAEETAMMRMIHLNGPSILFGIARGIVGQATGASLHGQFVLPTVNFFEIMKAKAEAAHARLVADSEPATASEES